MLAFVSRTGETKRNMAGLLLQGVFTALVTPFDEDQGVVDMAAFEALCERQLAAGISGLVPCGTTGETPTLSGDEQLELIRCSVKVAAGKVPVLAGTGSNDTRKTLRDSEAALKAGADGVMLVMPYYSKPSQAGLVHHVESVAGAVGCPVVLYNIPGRSAVELSVPSILTLLDRCPNVVGVKDATGNVLACQALLAKAGDRVQVMSGDDALSLPMLSVGASGLISVSSNALPGRVVAVVAAALAGDWQRARELHLALLDFHAVMFAEPNPAPVKAALQLLGLGNASLRAPLLPATAAVHDQLRGLLAELGEL